MNDIITADEIQKNEPHHLIFNLNEHPYAIDISNVLEIIKVPKLEIPQKMPKHIVGVMTYNGITINVIDLRIILSLPLKNYSIDSQIILVKTEEAMFGIIIDKVEDVKSLESEKLQSIPYHSENNLIKFLYRIGDDCISIIDLNSVQKIVTKEQFDKNDADLSQLFPIDKKSGDILLQRQRDIISKFENNIQQIYYDQEQYIIFELDKNKYALPIKNIKEIVKYKNINSISVPHSYDYIKGVFNFRGDFISILDFKIFLNMGDTKSVLTDLSKLIVLDVKDFKLALFVDNIIDIITVTPNEIVSKFDDKFESKFISSEIHINDKIISIISLEKILADKRLYIKD